MTRADSDTHAPPAPLFDLEPANVPAPVDGCGTGDLLAELAPLYDAALPDDAPGAWIRRAIVAMLEDPAGGESP
jgi:hypothetical protein